MDRKRPIRRELNDWYKKTRVYVDGSKKDGIDSILAQYDYKTGSYQPVRYNIRDIRPLKDAETRYSQIEVKSLAVHHLQSYRFATTTNKRYPQGSSIIQ